MKGCISTPTETHPWETITVAGLKGKENIPPRNVFHLEKMGYELVPKKAKKGHRGVGKDVGSFLLSGGRKEKRARQRD